MALQELAKLDEYAKELEKSLEQQASYITELEKSIDRQTCLKCGSSSNQEDAMQIEATE